MANQIDSESTIGQGSLLIEIATRNVVCLSASDSMGQAAAVLSEKRISCVVVTAEDAYPQGIVTERNVLYAMQTGSPYDTPLRELMSSPVITVPDSITSLDAYQLCLRDGIRHLVIVDKNNRMQGVVSETDFRLHIDLNALAGRRLVASAMSQVVFNLPPEASLQEALDLMRLRSESCVVVVRNECPVGIVTERDVVRMYGAVTTPSGVAVKQIMTAPVLTIALDATVNEAARRMLSEKVRHLVAVDKAGRVAGLLSEHDLTQTLALNLIDNKLIADGVFLRTLVSSIPDLIWLKDINGVYRACNPRFEQLFGVSEKEIVGKTDDHFFSREQVDVFRATDRIAMQRGGPCLVEEWVTFADDGHRELLETLKTPMHDSQGKLIGVLGIARDITARKSAEQALQQSLADYSELVQRISVGVYKFRMQREGIMKFDYVSPRWCQLMDLDEAEVMRDPQSVLTRIYPEDLDGYMRLAQDARSAPSSLTWEGRVLTKNGQQSWQHVECQPNRLDTGEIMWSGIQYDVTDRRMAEDALRINASVFDNSQEAILITDSNNLITDVNPAFTHITGYSREEVLSRNPKLLSSGRQSRDFYAAMWQSMQANKSWRGEIWNRRKSGDIYAELLSITAICDSNGKVQRHVGIFSDISYIKEHEAELRHVANFDPLTGIPNRRLLSDRLQQDIVHAKRNNKTLAICYIDIDGFKQVNDAFGHETGDQLLVSVTRRLQEVLRSGDTLARLGGDEFVVLLNDLAHERESLQLLNRVLDTLARPVTIGHHDIKVSASLGVTFYPADMQDGDTLLRHADQSMYLAKQSGKNRYHLYDSAQDQSLRFLHEARHRILLGLVRNEFELFYQPKVELATGRVYGVEALIRWQHPERGLLQPNDFLRDIDDCDEELTLGEWVMDHALGQAGAWQLQGIELEISINISARHLQSNNFISELARRLTRYPQLPRNTLQIEVLETVALEDIAKSAGTIDACRELGVKFALDDFGTGYSSLAYLRKLSAETLKIDQSFVRGMLVNDGDRAIVQGIIALAKSFGRDTVAEGIEHPELIPALLEAGCRYGQGYCIARPMSAGDFLQWLKLKG